MTAAKTNFRCALLNYLLDPSSKNKKELKSASSKLYFEAADEAKQLALEKAQKSNKEATLDDIEIDIDKINTQITAFVETAIENIYINEKKLQALQKILDGLSKEEAVFCTVLTDLTETLKDKNRVVSNDRYQVFATIYPIELDGHRIKKDDSNASEAALTLSRKLLSVTSRIHTKNKLEQNDTKEIESAYKEAKGHGIENHRGANFKGKFYNFCRALSCVFLVPIAYYAHKGTVWTTTKTKTQKDVENSQDAINEFQQSFQKQ
ncbi:hypothetical protein ACTAZI_04480 [Legionella bozemanae]|uniref:hypothetical protein n=1 Tax=Legionella bozemanae TaxID=447 RepID=UPI00399D2603